MARWRLTDAHYLSVEGTEWEYKETDQTTGRQGRKIFPVPLYLNPKDAADHNYPGEIVVSNKPYNRDLVFSGEPTADMEPLDEEAEKISAALQHKWVNPIDKINMNYDGNYSQSLLTNLERKIDEVRRHQAPLEPVSLNGIDPKDFAKLQAQVAELMEANAKLQAQILEKPLRRV